MSETTEYVISKKSDLTEIANAIINTTGSVNSMTLNSIPSIIENECGNCDDLLVFFGANSYEVSQVACENNLILEFNCSAPSVEDIKAIFCYESNLISGISLAIPEYSTSYLSGFIYIGSPVSISRWIKSDNTFLSDSFYLYSVDNSVSHYKVEQRHGVPFDSSKYYSVLVFYNTAE